MYLNPPPLPSLPPWFSAVLVLILVIFRGIRSLVFSKGSRLKKKMKPKFLDFRQFLTLLPSPPSDFRLFWFLFWKYFATFFTLFSYGSRFQSNWSKNDWIFGSFWSHFGIFPDDYCVIFEFSLEYCKISDNYSKIN